jgi:hypothetical protein
LVPEVGKGVENGFSECSHSRSPTGRRLRHSGVIPLDVVSQKCFKLVEAAGIPCIQKPFGKINGGSATHPSIDSATCSASTLHVRPTLGGCCS